MLASVKAGRPWSGAALFSSMRDAAKHYFNSVPEKCDVLARLLHDELCAEICLGAPMPFGSDAHFSRLRGILRERLANAPKGRKGQVRALV